MIFEEYFLFIVGFLINAISAFIIIRGIYYPKQKDYNFIFTFLAFNTVIYFVMGLFTSVALSIGVGFGLFALFSVLRYRTESVPIREMTYLFVMVALPVLNSVLFDGAMYAKLIISNGIIIGAIFALEKGWGFSYEGKQQISYEKVELIHKDRREELLSDLTARTGLTITGVDILHIDYLKDTAELMVRYSSEKSDDIKAVNSNKDLPSEDNKEMPQIMSDISQTTV